MNHWHINQAVKTINTGGVIAYPTESVYGLGCCPEDFKSVIKILNLKNRSLEKGLILVAASIEQLEDYIFFPTAEVKDRVLATWPGPVTWLMPARPTTPLWITGCHSTVAVRISAHPVVHRLCEAVGALVSTSANPGGYPPAKSAFKVLNYFGDTLDYILHGEVEKCGRPTIIKDAQTGKVIRN